MPVPLALDTNSCVDDCRESRVSVMAVLLLARLFVAPRWLIIVFDMSTDVIVALAKSVPFIAMVPL